MITTGRLVPLKSKVEKMLKSKDTELCDFGGECFGVACKKFWTCKRYRCTREDKKGNKE